LRIRDDQTTIELTSTRHARVTDSDSLNTELEAVAGRTLTQRLWYHQLPDGRAFVGHGTQPDWNWIDQDNLGTRTR